MIELDSVVCHERPRRKHFDWCILSVLGYICCAPMGLCAMYYSMRANHGHDHNIEEYKIHDSSTKAKVLTILSIILGSLVVIVMVILTVVLVSKAQATYTDIRSTFNNMNGRYNQHRR